MISPHDKPLTPGPTLPRPPRDPAPPREASLPRADQALVEVGRALRRAGYTFTTITPASHERVVARPSLRWARDLRDVFGWSRPFRPEDDVVGPALLELLEAAGAVAACPDGGLRSRVRFSSLGGLLLAHSAFPTSERDAVFLGPDSHRFLSLLEREARPAAFAIDVGCGTGLAGLWLAQRGLAAEVLLADVNPEAVRLARVNARINDITTARAAAGDLFAAAPPTFDLAVFNPPYLVDDAQRAYRDGGGALGLDLALRFVVEGLPRLAVGGRLILYTGAPVVRGVDPLRRSLEAILMQAADDAGDGSLVARYDEIDPDVFGEELARDAYAEVDRIAVVSLVVDRVRGPLARQPALPRLPGRRR